MRTPGHIRGAGKTRFTRVSTRNVEFTLGLFITVINLLLPTLNICMYMQIYKNKFRCNVCIRPHICVYTHTHFYMYTCSLICPLRRPGSGPTPIATHTASAQLLASEFHFSLKEIKAPWRHVRESRKVIKEQRACVKDTQKPA